MLSDTLGYLAWAAWLCMPILPPLLLLIPLYLLWRWLWPKVLRDAKDVYHYVTDDED